ncbi:AAA family ATPase [bacterium AH-315-I18]|nr:AAA family ATPase [Phycisphaeraceae bacterium]MBN4060887.1 AAA family ATPase [bacterium AH-315-I18]
MRTIAIINQKGGCGKTTVSINLAAVLASQGHRTLLVDMDPQGHCALGLAVPEAQIHQSIADMMLAGLDGSMAMADIVWQISRNFDLVPATTSLAGVEVQLANASDRDRRLVQVLSTIQSSYDFCIIDCPPSIGLLTFNALRACDEVIVPVETGYFALQGSFKQEATVEMMVRRTGHQVRHKVLATMYDVRTKLAREILSELKKHFDDRLLPIVINFNAKLKEAASFGQPITEYDPTSRGMQDFEQLAAWLAANPPEPSVSSEGVDEVAPVAHPALSRAAELVERARALSARTASLASKIAADPAVSRTGLMQEAERESNAQSPDPVIVSENVKRMQRLFGVRKTNQGILFVQPEQAATQISIAGDFNNWSPTATLLKKDDKLGVWQTCIPVPPGRYRYRVVIDGQWKHDQYNTSIETNPFGELNSILEVG